MWLLAAAAPRELKKYRNLRPKLVLVLGLLHLPLGEGDDGGAGGGLDQALAGSTISIPGFSGRDFAKIPGSRDFRDRD